MSSRLMESSQSYRILLDMLRSELSKALSVMSGESNTPGRAIDEAVTRVLEAFNETLLEKFELVPKADYEAQASLVQNLIAQLSELEERLEKLERDSLTSG